ncbi:thioredoxin domain-containing protein [Phytohabitans sp. ZYX-F-186]|uniref:Thioredoxin domain-containing protein n=1 Tax=Phytohabitans maris TaxID=3071409 RepID=A0ABU0ZWK7_9ACTN|nr:thioredoxin domain-containing protein [Phytohabitans sp. ZYX-F-186]MDQ7910704.1 thioredoxin domain-containing protein [Phytohabitans sp. ZYX-F-186]
MDDPFRLTMSRLRGPVTEEDHLLGSSYAPVTLVEYGDYQCPGSAVAHGVVREVLRQRPTKVAFVYRHFPLTDVHPYSEIAAEAAEAAAARGRFWQMHDWLFAHQDHLKPLQLALAVDRLGLDVERVGRAMGGHHYLARIRRDFGSGVRSGVAGTPTFFVNGIRHDAPHSLEALLSAVDDAADT